jgi:hypothetical protein
MLLLLLLLLLLRTGSAAVAAATAADAASGSSWCLRHCYNVVVNRTAMHDPIGACNIVMVNYA